MSRNDLLVALQEDCRGSLAQMKCNELKYFILRNKTNFCTIDDPDSVTQLEQACRDKMTKIKDIAEQCHWHGLDITDAKMTQLLDLMYEPKTSKLFSYYKDRLVEWRGYGSVVFVCGKRAVLLTNKPYNGCNDVSYQAVNAMSGGIPDLHIVPWYVVNKECWNLAN